MNILSFDTTLNRCSVAVLAEERVLAHKAQDLQRGHAEALMPMIQEALDDAELAFADLDLVAVTTGPGTFTGQRVGLSAARGIGVARKLPVQGVGTLPAIAHAARAESANQDILVVLDARRGEFYFQHFPAGQPIRSPGTMPGTIATGRLADVLPDTPCLLVGNGVALAQDILGPENTSLSFSTTFAEADAVAVAQLAQEIVKVEGLPAGPPAPLYLRAPDAKLPGGKSL